MKKIRAGEPFEFARRKGDNIEITRSICFIGKVSGTQKWQVFEEETEVTKEEADAFSKILN